VYRYIPDVSRSLAGMMQQVKSRGNISDHHRALFTQMDQMSDTLNKEEDRATSAKKKKAKQDPTTALDTYSDKLFIGKLTDAVTKLSGEEEIGQEAVTSSSSGGVGKLGKRSSDASKLAVNLFLSVNKINARHIAPTSCHDEVDAAVDSLDNVIDLSQDFSIMTQESAKSSTPTGRWVSLRGEIAAKIWVPHVNTKAVQAYEIRK
jgi:hypothetical protein